MSVCKAINCSNIVKETEDFCPACVSRVKSSMVMGTTSSMSEKYPAYYKSVEHLSEIDVYAVHQLFQINDPSGAIQHASKKLLLSGSRTGGKSGRKDIEEARDTLTRWLQLNELLN